MTQQDPWLRGRCWESRLTPTCTPSTAGELNCQVSDPKMMHYDRYQPDLKLKKKGKPCGIPAAHPGGAPSP